MKFRRIVLIALSLVFVIALVVFLISKYASLFLPQAVNSNIILWGLALSGAATFVAALKDIVEFIEKIAGEKTRANASELAAEFRQSRIDAINKRNREIMLKKVEVFWIKGVLENSLHGALLLQLDMEYRPDMVEHPWNMILHRSGEASQVLPGGIKVIEIFDELGGSLLILGEPGSGKTTALLELTRDLVNQAKQDDTNPIPVVFNLSSWAESRKAIDGWLVDELNMKYDIPNQVGEGWVGADELLLLLDGLDEVREEHREECVEAINRFRREHMVKSVVCSRTADYTALTKKLMLPGAIVQKSLTSEQINRYLASLGPKLSAVRKIIKIDSIMRQLASSPLVLSIMALAYNGNSMDDFRPGTLEESRDRLFRAYIARMFEHRNAIYKYKPDQIIHKLIWLSKLMKSNVQTDFHIEQLQPYALSSNAGQTIYKNCIKLIIWLLPGLSLGFSCGLAIGLTAHSLIYGIITGIFYGLTGTLGISIAVTASYQLKYRTLLGIIFGCAIALTVWAFVSSLVISLILGTTVGFATIFAFTRIGGSTSMSAESDALLKISTSRKKLGWSWKPAARGFIERIPLGAAFGLASGVTVSFVFGWRFGLVTGILLCLTMGIVGAISHGMIDINVAPISRPNEGIWWSLQNGLRFGIISGLWLGCVLGCLGGILTNLASGLAIGLSFLFASLVLAMFIGGGFAVVQHSILRILLYYYEGVPLNYPEFLNCAVSYIFLRKVGGGYIFIHRLLLEHFAAREYTLSD